MTIMYLVSRAMVSSAVCFYKVVCEELNILQEFYNILQYFTLSQKVQYLNALSFIKYFLKKLNTGQSDCNFKHSSARLD